MTGRSHPYFAFDDAGYEVELFSPDGGACQADAMSDPRDPSGYSASDLISMGFISTPKLAALVASTRQVAQLEVGAFDAIVVAGGQAPMFTFDRATTLHAKFVAFYEAGKVAAALCHGVAVLRYAKLVERRAARAGQDGDGLRQRRGGLRRQRGVEA